jgi:hypothetical protein
MPTSIEEAVQDPGFQAAPPTQQMAYLSSVDPDFKNAKAEDQLAYLNHITGKQAPTTADNSVEKGEAAPITNKASLFEKAKAIPAALAPGADFKPADAAGRMASGAWSGLKAMNPFSGMPSTDEDKAAFVKEHASPSAIALKSLGPAGELAKGGVEGYQKARSGGAGVIPSVGAGLANMFGLDTQGIKERASQGDVAGVIGEGIPAIAATVLGGESEHLPAVKDTAAKVLRTPEGDLRPIVEKGAKVAGAAAGHILGPIGSIAGYEAGPGILNKLVPDRMPAVERPFTPQGPQLPIENRTPGGLPVVSDKPLTLANPEVGRETAIQPSLFPSVEGAAPAAAETPGGMPSVSRNPIDRVADLVQAGAGTPEGRVGALDPAVSLREQRQLQKPFGNRAAVEVSELHGPRTTAPEKIPQVLSNTVDQAMGADVTPEAKEKARLQEKYPDAGDRQAIYRTSEKMFEATRDNPKLRKALGDLKAHDNQGGPDLARAAANLGEDLGERRIGNKKKEWMGSGQVGRAEMFDKLLDAGHTPQEILDAAEKGLEPVGAGKPGPMRAAEQSRTREKAGD